MSKIRDTDYLTLSTRVRAMETRLVTRERMERMLDARTDEEAVKILTECGYGELTALTHAGLDELLSAARGAIPESQPAPLGEEVPVALFLEDGGASMKSLTPQSYFTPQELADMDVAQAVTLEFSAG